MTNKTQIGIGLLAMVWTAAAVAGPVRIKVTESSSGGNATYSYRVENGSTQPIVIIRIGFDSASGQPTLQTFPVGWTFDGGLPPSSAASPQGWTASMVTMEESELGSVQWSSDTDPLRDIAPGATLSGFSVQTAAPAPEYRTATFDVILGDGTHASGTLEPDGAPADTTPPTLQVTLTPSTLWPPNHKMVGITATITVSDVDSNPTVRLVSITANDAIGADD